MVVVVVVITQTQCAGKLEQLFEQGCQQSCNLASLAFLAFLAHLGENLGGGDDHAILVDLVSIVN